jgi:Sap, sulfolipid-1-addressing protein
VSQEFGKKSPSARITKRRSPGLRADMGQGISEVLPFAIGVAISPVPIIAVILLFSARARTNGPAFLLGWIVGLGVVCAVAYSPSDSADVSTSSGASDTVSWGKIGLGALLLVLAMRNWRKRPGPGEWS